MTARQRGRPSLASLVVDLGIGLMAALGQAPWNLWFLTVIAMGLLCWRISASATARRAAWHAFAAGFGHFALAMSWIVEPFLVEADVYGWMAPFALILMAAGGALFWTLPGWLAARLAPGMNRAALAFAGLIVLSDWLRGWIFTGLPWALTGHIWISTPAGQTASVFGALGLSTLTMLAASLPLTFRQNGRGTTGGAVLSVLLIGTAWSFGMARLSQPLPADTDQHIRLIQPNATQALKWDPYWSEVFFRRLLDLSAARDPGQPAPDAVIWPETAVNFLLDQSGTAPQDIAAYAGAPVILGIQRAWGERYYNSLTEFSAKGIGPVYDKFHLVPFGEYTPWGDVMARFGIRAFAAQHGFGYSPGPGPQVMQLETLPPMQPLICYEAVFPQHLITGANRPQWLLQVTNDGWFGQISGPWQHLAQARLRAIESGLPLMRAANTGISAVIDARGQIRAELDLNREGRIDARLPGALPPTPWATWRDWPALILACALVILAIFRRRLTQAKA
ncbi:apolipoprotein N-acyltransferase [Paracoccus shanxieyensis]|uniref:Apolipoprotein N-acyltransferase n=1 Tax=Paracoccus shanxieyensis TaxID=2675752 RepID=A0A6L6ITN6_9RHOB|nr:apolipoprotein N-acyltransferase [Paracoccus shanxieyensis]MTH63895.1 apolipoprotein N-acyltransferase [Paracoccus shanxieyensis]MTH86593.1 apolipoprotein N-acyltransferase [Paracoccus shanxieyensis]